MSKSINLGAYKLYRANGRKNYSVLASHPKLGRLWESTKCSDAKKAEKRAKEIYAKWLNEPKLKPGSEVLFADLWEEYLQMKETRVAYSTFKRIQRVGEHHLCPNFGSMFLSEVGRSWQAFVSAQRKKDATCSLSNERKYLRNVLRYAYEIEVLDKVPILRLEIKTKVTPKVYSEPEIKKLLNGCADDEDLRLQILMGLTMGMRHAEICHLSLERVNIDRRSIILTNKDTKTRKAREIRMSELVFEIVEARVRRLQGKTRWLFPMKSNAFQHMSTKLSDSYWLKLKERVGVRGRFHDLRHTAATRLAKSGVKAEVVCAYLGMSLRVFDEVYCHLGVEDTAQVASVIDVNVPLQKVAKKSEVGGTQGL